MNTLRRNLRITRRAKTVAGAALLAAATLPLAPAWASGLDPSVTLGGGLRTSFSHAVDDGSASKSNDFALDSVRLYINGQVMDHIKFTVDTEYQHSPGSSVNNTVQVIDAIGRFEYSDELNIWAGRFLPPVDRANLYGPYYADNWAVYNDGIADDYPSAAVGRDDGVAYWGQFGILKVSLGAFDVPQTTGKTEILTAGRVMVDLWDPEPGYYLNGTYYGEKNILAIGLAGQSSAQRHVYSADLLVERNFKGVGTFTLESEYARNQHFGAYGTVTAVDTGAGTRCSGGCYGTNHGYYVLAAYLLPVKTGPGTLQLLGKFGNASYADPDPTLNTLPGAYDQHTSEVDLNYIIKSFNARVSLFYLNQARGSGFGDARTVGLGLQLQI